MVSYKKIKKTKKIRLKNSFISGYPKFLRFFKSKSVMFGDLTGPFCFTADSKVYKTAFTQTKNFFCNEFWPFRTQVCNNKR